MLDIAQIARHSLLIEDSEGTKCDRCPILNVYDYGSSGPIGDAVCTIGAFDGIHQGHRYLIDSMIANAKQLGLPSIIMTFDVDPDEFFRPPVNARKLLNNKDRLSFLSRLGADYVVVIPFSHELANLNHKEFFGQVIFPLFHPVEIHVGCNFRLGAGGTEDVNVLSEWARNNNSEIFSYDLFSARGLPVSATRIRNHVANGEIRAARELLGRPYFVRGVVKKGRGAGSKMGFPTANVQTIYPYQLPGDGVYSGMVTVDDMVYPAAISVGAPVTFSNKIISAPIEATLLGFSGNLYDRKVEVIFYEKLREMIKFSSVQDLQKAVLLNIEEVEEVMGCCGQEV